MPCNDSEPERRPSYRAAVAAGKLPGGLALDDGVAVLCTDGRPTQAVTRAHGARLFRVERAGGGEAEELVQPCELLTGAM